ncbi:MAG: allose kinase [Ruminiclostridium sp.]
MASIKLVAGKEDNVLDDIIIGIDLGGTNLRIGAVTQDNQIKASKIINSSIIADAENPTVKLGDIIESYMNENQFNYVKAISIGVPSSVATDKKTVVCTTNIRNSKDEAVFYHINIASDLQTRFEVPIFLNNDTNNILLYDVVSNNLEEQSVVVGIYIGTGVGSSVLIEGKSLVGADGVALDLGHIPYYEGKAQCSCGKLGCCECYASGWRLQQIREEFFPDTDIKELFTLHREEEPLREFIYSCAHVFAIIATIFNPNIIIVGGGVIEMKDFPREQFEKEVNRNTGRDVMSYGFNYIYSEEFSGKGVIGAAIFAKKMLNKCIP